MNAWERYVKRPRHQRRRIASADIVIVSFPKSGRTWLRLLIGKALCDRYDLPKSEMLDTRELTRAAGLPVTIFSHEGSGILAARHYKRLGRDKRAYRDKKVILLVREPRDVVVSCFFQASRRLDSYAGDLSSFLREPRYGIRKVLTWYNIWNENRHVPREFHLMRYEDIHAAPEKALRGALEFIGATELADEALERAVEFCRFDNMRRLETNSHFDTKGLQPGRSNDPESYKTRKGEAGGYVDYLDAEDLAYSEQEISKQGYAYAAPGS